MSDEFNSNIPVTIHEKWEEFNKANPHVAVELHRLARQAKAAGRKKVGMKMLFEVLRWNYMLRTNDPTSDFKLNNNYTSEYARYLMEQDPAMQGLFEIRELKAER